jgi:hypothetical protein
LGFEKRKWQWKRGCQPHPLVAAGEAYHLVAEEGCGYGGDDDNFDSR